MSERRVSLPASAILGKVQVTIVEAKGIESDSASNTLSPYINVRVKNLSTLLKSKKQRTEVKEGATPTFNENNVFSFHVSDFEREIFGMESMYLLFYYFILVCLYLIIFFYVVCVAVVYS
jgi:hypothetical protein